ncbi:uncharacterized protein LOC114770486 [Denticeps clupeoides]|uniref:uncharacterized protein LOC114770486 n=1 Tax=Denticeps clupeoides TaxID=299321 RepID=UPI0010A2B164|nr:uncharacterized protein LOC114770486 [Denticeps clupeoides]
MSLLRLLCSCCCPQGPADPGERERLLQNTPESARQFRPSANDGHGRTGRFTARHVGVAELDQRFEDAAETFNLQQGHHEAMTEHLNALRDSYNCPRDASLSECIRRIKDEHNASNVILYMRGYEFSLVVGSGGEVPVKLKAAQERVKALCQATKAVVAAGTKLQQMIGWLLQSEHQLTRQVLDVAPAYQEKRRLEDNLKENLQESRRANEHSSRYREEAGKLLNEAALLSGVNP